jgi:putative SOS response-associated peptidase YedK
MCTRFSFDAPREKMKRQFNLNIKQELDKSYNIAAGDNAYVLTNQSLDLKVFQWGLIPHWAQNKEVGENLINAMSEGIETKLSFRLAIRQRRCLIFADSYYEWHRQGLETQPYRVQLADQRIMAFAGVWDVWKDEKDQLYRTFSIITVPANEDLDAIEAKRMPVILTEGSDQARWLSEVSLQSALNLLNPLEKGQLSLYPISKEVDDPANDYIELHRPIDLEKEV